MMIINLSPVRMDTTLTLKIEGDKVYVNNEVADFTQLLEGATLPYDAIGSNWFPGDVSREGGEITLTIRLPHGPNAPVETRFPASPIIVRNNGEVTLPIYDIPAEEDYPEVETVEVTNE